MGVWHSRRLLRAWSFGIFWSLTLVSLVAQGQTGVVEGGVADTSGGVIADANVVLRNVETNQNRRTVTDRYGTFRIADVPVGTYEVRVEVSGFAPSLHTGLTLAIGQTVRLAIVMQPAGIIESAVVSAQPPPIDVRQTSVATAVDTERIEELPVRSRNYLEFVLLAPGVSGTASASRTTSTGSSNVPDSGFSFGGLRSRSNSLTIDGLDNNDEFAGSSRTELSLEAVREFQVLSNGWSAENIGAAGGAINVVTKSGANTIHGDAFLFAQSSLFNARAKLDAIRDQAARMRRYRGGMAIGGPLVRDRIFYYAAAEREDAQDHAASDIDPDAARAINRALREGLFPEVATRQLSPGLFSTARKENEWSAKLTHELAGRGVLVGRLSGTDRRDEGDAFNTDALSDMSTRGTTTTHDKAITTSLTTTLGRRTTTDVRVQLAWRRLASATAQQQGAGVVISGVAAFGTPYAGNNTHDQTYVDVGDTVAHSRGSHFVKAGAAVRGVTVSGRTADGIRGVYLFRTLETFLAGTPNQTRLMSSDADVDLSTTRAGVFIQDHWTPRPHITIDAGARVDMSVLPSVLDITSRALSPRFGFAWMPADRWIVRGGAGLFADRFVLASMERGWLAEERHVVEFIADGTTAAAPSIYRVKRGRWNTTSRQASVAIERQLTSTLTASVNYLLVRGHRLSRTDNVNLAPPTVLTASNAASLGVPAPLPQQLGRAVFGRERLDPEWDGIFELQPSASSTYHGVSISAHRRFANEIEWSAAYTWSRARDSASDFDEQPQNPYALDDEWSASRYDQRHRFVASALFELPIGDEDDRRPGHVADVWERAFRHIEVAPILTVGSGLPANITTGGDENRTGAFSFTARPLGVVRNSWRSPASLTLDLRVLRFFNIKPHGRLDVVVEAFNLLNRTNVIRVNTVHGPYLTALGTLGQPIEASPARQLQFSLDFEF